MTTGIFYFSGTGNSLVMARDIARELGDAKVISLSRAMREGVDPSFDRIGIVFPVYIWGLPLIVTEFIRKLSNPSAYYFAVATFGGMSCSTLEQAQKLFAARELTLSAGFSVRMPGNYTPMYGAIPEEKQKEYFTVEKAKAKEIADAVRAGRKDILETDTPLLS